MGTVFVVRFRSGRRCGLGRFGARIVIGMIFIFVRWVLIGGVLVGLAFRCLNGGASGRWNFAFFDGVSRGFLEFAFANAVMLIHQIPQFFGSRSFFRWRRRGWRRRFLDAVFGRGRWWRFGFSDSSHFFVLDNFFGVSFDDGGWLLRLLRFFALGSEERWENLGQFRGWRWGRNSITINGGFALIVVQYWIFANIAVTIGVSKVGASEKRQPFSKDILDSFH